jgi:hypothetical protein
MQQILLRQRVLCVLPVLFQGRLLPHLLQTAPTAQLEQCRWREAPLASPAVPWDPIARHAHVFVAPPEHTLLRSTRHRHPHVFRAGPARTLISLLSSSH